MKKNKTSQKEIIKRKERKREKTNYKKEKDFIKRI
jgi:hypothetical protein